MPLKKRQKVILAILRELGGEATTREIAEKAGLNVNGVSQSLGALSDDYVLYLGGRGGETTWRLETGGIHHLVVDDSEESQEARKLLVKAGHHPEVFPADASEVAEGMRFPRLITSSGTIIGLESIRLFLGLGSTSGQRRA